MQRQQNFQFRMSGISAFFGMIVFFILLFFILKGLYNLLIWAAPVFLIIALIANYRTVLGFLRFLWDMLRKRPLVGIVAIILTVVLFPFVSGLLMGKALFDRKLTKHQQEVQRKRDGELIDYEDITDKPEKDVLVLKTPPPPQSKSTPDNTYDEFFEVDKDGD